MSERIILQAVRDEGTPSPACLPEPDAADLANTPRIQVSVIVVNWNRGDLLRGCLRSLAAQRGVEFEIIVVDNGSTDHSAQVVEDFQNSTNLSVQLIRNAGNLGFCAANNQGIAAARGEFIALLNNDAEAEAEWLLSMWRELANSPAVGMIACKILVYEDPRKIDKAGHLIYPDGQNRGRGTGEIDIGQYDRVEEVLWPDGCAALYRKAMLDEIGGFDEDLFAYADDAELGLRARVAGWRCLYTPQAVVRHRRGSTLGVLSSRRLELIERNRILLAVKHFPPALLWLNGFFFAARLGAGLYATVRGRGEAGRYAGGAEKLRMAAAFLRGFVQGLLLVPRTLAKRRAMRRLRRLSSKEVRELLLRHKISLKALTEQAI